MTNDWQGPINQLLYGLSFTREITDEVVAKFADAAVEYTVLGLGPEVYHWAIQEALASGDVSLTASRPPQFDHVEVEGYLRALAARLDELRPWPEPKFRRLDVATWSTFGHAVPIARLRLSLLGIRKLLRKTFDAVGASQPGLSVLMLRLQTGETVALLSPSDRDGEITLLTDATADAAEVINHFITATGMPEDKVTQI
jgi:hypothetical protein